MSRQKTNIFCLSQRRMINFKIYFTLIYIFLFFISIIIIIVIDIRIINLFIILRVKSMG